MLVIIFFIFLCAALFLVYTLDNKMKKQHMQMILLQSHNESLKSRISMRGITSDPDTVIIRYSKPETLIGTISTDCNLLLSPLNSSPVLNNLTVGTLVNIEDSAEICNSAWYEISYPSEGNINNKGWIKEDCIDLTH